MGGTRSPGGICLLWQGSRFWGLKGRRASREHGPFWLRRRPVLPRSRFAGPTAPLISPGGPMTFGVSRRVTQVLVEVNDTPTKTIPQH